MCRCPANKMFFHPADFTFHSSVRHLPYPQTLQRRFTHSSPTQLHTLFRHPCHHFSPPGPSGCQFPRLLTPFHFGSPVPARLEARTCLHLQPKTSVTNFRLLCSPGAGRRLLLTSLGETPRRQRPDSAGGPYLGPVIIEKSTAYFPDALGRRTKELPQSSSLPLVPPPNPGINPFTSMFIGPPLAGRLHHGEIPDT